MEASHVSQNGNPCDPTALLAKLNIHKKPISNKNTPNKAVNFTTNPDGEKKREKYLTAKYGAHQMALIRKRLKVEMWIRVSHFSHCSPNLYAPKICQSLWYKMTYPNFQSFPTLFSFPAFNFHYT